MPTVKFAGGKKTFPYNAVGKAQAHSFEKNQKIYATLTVQKRLQLLKFSNFKIEFFNNNYNFKK